MRKSIQICARSFSTTPQTQNKIHMKSFEYEPFKFGMERQALIHGYSMEELYGRYYGLKHTPEMRKELKKDNLVFVLLLTLGCGSAIYYNLRGVKEYRDWQKYYYSDMQYKRKDEQ